MHYLFVQWLIVYLPSTQYGKFNNLLGCLILLFSSVQFSSFQSLSRVRLFATPWIAARQASLSITNSRSSLRLVSIESMMPSSHLILCRPLLLLPLILPASESFPVSQLFTWGGQSFSFNIIPSKEHPGLISFRMDWLDLLAVQETLKSLLQCRSSKASILWRSAFFIVRLWHLYITTGKTIALTRQTFVGEVMSDSLRPHGLQQTRLPCPSPALRVCSNSCQLSWWCHPIELSLIS